MKVNRNKKIKNLTLFQMFLSALVITIGSAIIEPNRVQAQKFEKASSEATLALPPNPNEAANLDQCRNGGVNEPPAPCNGFGGGNLGYVNGNAGAENAHYREGDSIPYRIRFSGLTVFTEMNQQLNTIEIEYDTTQQGKHAIDYLTSYNRTETVGNDPCSDVLTAAQCSSPFDGAFNSTFPIPIDPKVVSSNLTRNQEPGVFTCFGCTITNVQGYRYTGEYSGNSMAALTVTFKANVSNPVLAFGGHIATRRDWGPNSSASTIPGSPYHTRLLMLNGASTGQQDRSLNSRAVTLAAIGPTPAAVTVSGRVLTQQGRGIRNALVKLVDEQGQTRTVITSAFGYYRFADVMAGQTYTITAVAKRYTFTQPSQLLSLVGDTEGVNFIAEN